jgi:haloacetate dehalogenase
VLQRLVGERGAMGRLYDVLAIWRERGTQVTGKGLPGGHNLQEDVPDQVLSEIQALLRP